VHALAALSGDRLDRLFWDVDVRTLVAGRHDDFVLARLLTQGDWAVVRGLRQELGDAGLASFVRRAGRRLDRRTRRFLEVVLGLEAEPCASSCSTNLSGTPFRH
jgi:hypothetical protein